MRYLLAIYGDSSTWGTQSADDAKAELDAFAAFEREAAEAGVLADSAALDAAAYTVSARGEGVEVEDGAVTGAEQRLACFYVIECESVAEAKEWASKVPLVGDGGFHSIEIRPVMP